MKEILRRRPVKWQTVGAARGLCRGPIRCRAVQAVLFHIDMLIMNQIAADQLTQALGLLPDQMDVQDVIVTLGADGRRWFDNQNGSLNEHPAIPTDAVDTTGAGDTFTGYILAGLDPVVCQWNRRSALHHRPRPLWYRVRVQRTSFQI